LKVVIPGGTGHLGGILTRAFLSRGDDVVVLSRGAGSGENPNSAKRSQAQLTVCNWDGKTRGTWADYIDGADLVINLAGRSVNCRYTEMNRRIIKDSRIQSTLAVGEAIAAAKQPPPLWLQMSTATIYAHRFDDANDEVSGIIGGTEDEAPDTWRFSIDVATAWERALDAAEVPSTTRKIKMRTAIVMSPYRGGPFEILLRLVRYGLGGTSGSGKQFVSWITDHDFVRAVDCVIESHHIEGPVNFAAPNPLPNREFMRVLREAWGISIGLPAVEWMLELGAIPLQTETELILKSRRVMPAKLIAAGFQFDFPHWDVAAKALCDRWRTEHNKPVPNS
jgi:uncharacterized protein (TIGR01777 family)